MVSLFYTIAAYTFIGITFVAVWYIRSGGTTGRPGRPAPPRNAASEARREPKQKRQRSDDYKAKAASTKEKPRADEAPAVQQNTWLSNDAGSKQKDADREFAKQLTSAKEGRKFSNRGSDPTGRQRSVKQSRASQISDFADDEKTSVSAASESASPMPSPAVAPADPADDVPDVPAEHDPAGIADMLAPPPPPAGVLRLVNTDSPKPVEREAKPREEKESKKQRQNRKKVEQAKIMREEAEKDRKKRLETQRRLVRVSEGRPAKDGSQFMASLKAAEAAKAQNPEAVPPALTVRLLDTLEDLRPAPEARDGSHHNDGRKTISAAASSSSLSVDPEWMSSLPSEEEQMEMLLEDSEWSTVQTKASKRSKKKGSMEAKEVGGSAAEPPAAGKSSAPVAPTPGQPGPHPKTAKPATGSFAALGTNDGADEEEWDV